MKRIVIVAFAFASAFASACGGSGASSPPSTSTSPPNKSPATPHQVSPEHQKVIAAIDAFLRDPPAGDLKAIMDFVRISDDVLVVYDQRLIPLSDGQPEGTGAVLLAAFAAGSARSQLVSGIKGNDPVAGTRAMLTVYRFLKAKNPAVSTKTLDDLSARDTGGSLDAAVAERLAEPQR